MRIGCAALYPIAGYEFPYSFDNYLKAVAEMHSAGFEYCKLEVNVDSISPVGEEQLHLDGRRRPHAARRIWMG